MIEERYTISDVLEAKSVIESLGAVFSGDYVYKDEFFVDRNDKEIFLKLRIYSKNNWDTKGVILISKSSESKSFRQEFETKEEGVAFIKKNFPEFEYLLEVSRIGSQYDLDKMRIFVEDIEKIGSSIEIEAPSEIEINLLLDKINVGKRVISLFQKIQNLE
ncbi:MAG: hypothetical protein V1756_02755 [Patescibacteria group bacterium]